MSIAVVLATRNGARTLPLALAGHAALRPAPAPHRLVAVDNGSTDDTPAILAAARDRLPLTVLREGGRGKNRALNRALPEAAGADLVVFTDDDVVPEPDWLERLWAAATAQSGHALFGGAIRPHWLAPPPRWIFDWGVHLGVAYAVTEPRPSGPIPADLVWGPNMAVRGSVLREGHRFDERVGPDGSAAYGMGSETEFTVRLQRLGHRAFFVAEAAVGHIVRPEQTTEAWVLGRAFRHGLGFHRYHPPPPRGRLPRVGGLPAGFAVKLAAYRAAAAAARALPASRARFRVMWQAEWLRGAAGFLRRQAQRPPAG